MHLEGEIASVTDVLVQVLHFVGPGPEHVAQLASQKEQVKGDKIFGT